MNLKRTLYLAATFGTSISTANGFTGICAVKRISQTLNVFEGIKLIASCPEPNKSLKGPQAEHEGLAVYSRVARALCSYDDVTLKRIMDRTMRIGGLSSPAYDQFLSILGLPDSMRGDSEIHWKAVSLKYKAGILLRFMFRCPMGVCDGFNDFRFQPSTNNGGVLWPVYYDGAGYLAVRECGPQFESCNSFYNPSEELEKFIALYPKRDPTVPTDCLPLRITPEGSAYLSPILHGNDFQVFVQGY